MPTNFFHALINGAAVFTTTSRPFPITGVYQQIFANFTATGTATTLESRYRHDDDFWRLDDVAVRPRGVPGGGAPSGSRFRSRAAPCFVHFRLRGAASLPEARLHCFRRSKL